MRHLHILCEGQTEEMLASDVIESHLVGADAYVTWSVLTTKRPAGGPAFKGGVSTWPVELDDLHGRGVITAEELAAGRAKVIGGN